MATRSTDAGSSVACSSASSFVLGQLSKKSCTYSCGKNSNADQSPFCNCLSWNHSVVFEPDFVDPWTATDQAFHLAAEVSLGNCFTHQLQSGGSTDSCDQRAPTLRGRFAVSFSDCVELFIGLEDEHAFHRIKVPHQSFAGTQKPWTLRHCSTKIIPSNDISGFSDAQHGSLHEVVETACAFDQKVLPWNPQSIANRIRGCTRAIFPAPRRHGKPVRSGFLVLWDLKHTAGRFHGPLFSFHDQNSRPPIRSETHNDTEVGEPLSFLAVLNSFRCPEPSKQHDVSEDTHWFTNLRRDHESPVGWDPNAPATDAHDEDLDEDPHQFDHNVLPAFANELANTFARLGFNYDDHDFEVPVRTWFIDHVTVRRWTAPRNLQLVGPPAGWEWQFSSLWVDQIDPDEWFDLTVITPDPPRPYALRHFVLDIVVTQSLELPRVAGLVTVIPEDPNRFDLFSVACSFEEHIGGFDIINAADIARHCRYQQCRITFGWEEIPLSLRPTHETSHGDGFQVLIRNAPAQLAQTTGSTSGSSSQAIVSSSAPSTSSVPPHASLANGTINMTDTTHSNSPSSNAMRFMTPLHLFQLQGHEVVMNLVNAQLVQPSIDMADALNVPLDCLEAVYPMPQRPLGFPELAIPAIVQRTGDIPYRSTDRLILIDTRYLYPPTATALAPQPTVVRTVHRIGYQVIRSHLLMTAGVFHYCRFLEEQCSVTLDGEDWPDHDHGSRPVRHGSYVLITVPPNSNPQLDTREVAQIIHDDAEHDAFMDFMMDTDLENDDASLGQFLLHTHAHTKVSRFVPGDDLAVAESQTDQLPQFHGSQARLPTLGAVLQPKVELNPQNDQLCHHAKTQNRPRQTLASESCQKPIRASDKAHHSSTQQKKDSKKTNDNRQQTKIDSFFHRKEVPSHAAAEGRKQLTIRHFFHLQKDPIGIADLREDSMTVTPEQGRSTATAPLPQPERTTQARCSDQQTSQAPEFQVPIPAQLPQGNQQNRPRPIWMIELLSLFEEHAITRHAETGPELTIDVWYVHHTRFPRCDAPREVRLDNIFDLWYADLCTAWFDHIERQAPLKVLIVKPRPVYAMRSHIHTHVILEQGMLPGKVALHFTALFQGGNRQGVYQVAESVPDHICTNIMIDLHDFWRFCAHRPCHMWSGIQRFHSDQPEEIFSGMSAVFVVQEAASSSARGETSHPENDASFLMQQRPVTRFNRRTQMGVIPEASSPSHQTGNSSRQHDHSNDVAQNSFDQLPAAQNRTAGSVPLLRIRDLAQFRQALVWQVDQMPALCRLQAPRVLTVHTWFSDADRMPRSDHYRAVLLGHLPMNWPFEIINRWQDWIDPNIDVTLQLVQPQPSGGNPDVAAHIIVIQTRHDDLRPALVTVVEVLEDPWHPTSFCTLLPALVNAQTIMTEAGITERCQPLNDHQLCEITHGSIPISGDMTFPVRDGYQFEVALSSLDEEWDAGLSLIQLGFARVLHKIYEFSREVQQAIQRSPVQHPGSSADAPEQAISVTIVPPLRQGTPADSFEFLHFHTVLQSAWQPLSLLSAQPHDPAVTVVTWYVDHIRFPQCFAARAVQLYQDPEEWTHLMRQAWNDLLLPDQPLHFHVVQPQPIEPEPDVALHVLLVQQPVQHFDTVLITIVDSEFAGFPPQRHASMAPHVIPYQVLLGIAYKDQECSHPRNTCSAWIGDQEILQHEDVPLVDGLSLTVAIHRHIDPDPQDLDPWDLTDFRHTNPPDKTKAYRDGLIPPQISDCQLADSLRQVVQPKDPSQHEISSRTPKVPLCLEITLPEPTAVSWTQLQPDTSAILWFQKSNWAQHCLQFPIAPPHPLPEGLKIHPASYGALLAPPLASAPETWKWEIYVDGSAHNQAAGWSVIVVGGDQEGTRLWGCYAGQVQLAPQHPQWFGAEKIDNITAELTAFIVAQDVCLRLIPDADVTIRPDLMLSQMVATFEQITHASPRLALLCRLLSNWLGKKTSVKQVPAHRGNPWNELADSVAKWAATQEEQSLTHWASPGLHELAIASHDLHWCWLQHASERFQQCFPPIVEKEVMQFPPSPLVAPPPTKPSSPDTCWISFAFHSVTANVLALDHFEHQNAIGRQTGNRTARLDHQLHAAGIAVAGIQEARTKQGRYKSEHYHIFSAGFQGPNPVCLGCELWIHQSLPFATMPNDTKLTMTDFKITTPWADPRRLFVLLENQDLTMTFVVLHTPCLSKYKGDGSRPIDAVEEWWNETTRLFKRLVGDKMVWVYIDANAPINDEYAPYTGSIHAETLNPQGRLFGKFLCDNALFAPSTFDQFHVGPGCTWTHSNGKKYRRDYVLVSQQVHDIVRKTQVLSDFDTTFCHDDHLPLLIQVQGLLKTRAAVADKTLWDEQALLCPNRIRAFRQALATLPVPTWSASVETHAAWYEQQLLQLGLQFFGKTTKTKNRPRLRATTLRAIAMKRHLLDCARKWNLTHQQEFKDAIKPLEKEVRTAVRFDLGVYYDQLLVQLQHADSLGDLRTVYKTLLRVGGRNRKTVGSLRPLPLLTKPDGNLTHTFIERQWVWMEQFAQLEAGQTVNLDNLQVADAQPPTTALDLQEPAAFPTIWDIQMGLRKLKRGRAPGPNGLPPALLKAGGEVFARQFLPLVTKCAAHSHEPLSWKGGRLFPLHKGKLHPSDPNGYRSIFVSDFTAKLYHATLRRPLDNAWMQHLHALQLGGRKGQGTDTAHHTLQTFWHWTTSRRTPSAIVFFDMRAAFYSVIREALFQGDGNLHALSQALTEMGIPPPVVQTIAPSIDADFALQGLSPHMLAILRDAMNNTHFYIEGIPHPCRTRRGTRPGDPIGDILFNMVMSSLLKDAKQTLQDQEWEWYGLPEQCANFLEAQSIPAVGYFDVSFVDDCAFGVHGRSNQQVEHGIQAVVEAMLQAAKRRGLIINFEPGKTEVLWNIVGKGSKERKAKLAEDGSQIKWRAQDVPIALRVTHAYKHLGTWLQAGNAHGREIQQRSSLARSTWGVLARPFYCKNYVSLHTKIKVFQSTALSQFMYNAHTWTGVSDKDWDKWHNALRKPLGLMIKPKLRGVSPLHLDMDAVSALAGVLPPRHAVHVARLRYLKRLMLHCPQILWNLIMADASSQRSWTAACSESFQWFRQHYPAQIAPQTDDFHSWIPLIALDHAWNGRLKKAAASCLQFCAAIAERQVFQIRFRCSFEAKGGILPVTSQPVQEKWQCEQCNRCFPSKRGLASHAARVHGYKRIERFYATHATCDACGKFYHARARLLMHLYDCPECLRTIQACFPPATEEEVKKLDDEGQQYASDMRQQGWWKTKAFQPPVRICGPLLPPPDSLDAVEFKIKWTERNSAPGTSYLELQGRCAVPDPSDEPQVHLFSEDVPAFVMHAPPGPNAGAGNLAQHGLAAETARLHIKWYVFVHFFSGYRRPDDLHAVIESTPLPEGGQLLAISVDMCMQRKDGNLASDSATCWWIARVKSGQIVGAGGGPPCETFTAARFLPDGPRPLRTGAFPDGLPGRTAKEWTQLRIGSRLVFFIFEILLEIAAYGGCGFVEHPQWPVWALRHDPASIWASQQARLCRTLQCFSAVSFDQCLLGSPAKKPTTLMLLRLDTFRQAVLRKGFGGRCNHSQMAHEQLQGRNSAGEFRTAVGKIYPVGLNQLLGRAVCRFARETFSGELLHRELPESFFCFRHQIFEDQGAVQPDYHGPLA